MTTTAKVYFPRGFHRDVEAAKYFHKNGVAKLQSKYPLEDPPPYVMIRPCAIPRATASCRLAAPNLVLM
ncbi:MAG TPA: hypothetical protein VF879_04190, partial [Nitrospirales bacterium]